MFLVCYRCQSYEKAEMKFLKSFLSLTAIASALLAFNFGQPSMGFASTTAPTCQEKQLEVTAGWGVNGAAGNEGAPIVVINTSNTTCSLVGYPAFRYLPTWKSHTLTINHRPGVIYSMPKPKVVLLRAGMTASSGFMFGNAANQNLEHATGCNTSVLYLSLPTSDKVKYGFEIPITFNICFSNFAASVTPLELGPLPQIG